MKLVRDRGRHGTERMLPTFVALSLVMALCSSGRIVARAQNTARKPEPPQMRQLHQALSLDEHGDGPGAMNIVRSLLEQNPKFVPAIKLKGMLLEESGNAVEAAATYEEGLQLAPNDPDLLLKVGIHRLVTGKPEEAIELLRHSARILPGDGDAQYYLAQAYHLDHKNDLALAAIRQSLKAEPGNPSVIQKYGELLSSSGNYQEGLRWLLKAQKADASLPRLDYEIGLADYKLMDIDGAALNLTKEVEAHPNDMDALELLADAQMRLTHWPQAREAYARLIAAKPDDTNYLLGLGHCQVELKDYEDAVDTLDTALRLDPTQLLAHFYLARAYAGLGNATEAQHEAALHQLMMNQQSFVRADEDQQRENAVKPGVRQMLTQLREDDALRLYRAQFKGSSATDADAYVFIGKLYLFMGKTDDGLRCLHRALAINPTVRGAHTNEGILALKLGELDKAEAAFKAELANDPNYQMAIAEMGEIRYRQGRWQEAADLLTTSRTMTPELLYMLCDAYYHVGKITEANLNAEAAAAYARNNLQFMNGLVELVQRNGQTELAARLSVNTKH